VDAFILFAGAYQRLFGVVEYVQADLFELILQSVYLEMFVRFKFYVYVVLDELSVYQTVYLAHSLAGFECLHKLVLFVEACEIVDSAVHKLHVVHYQTCVFHHALVGQSAVLRLGDYVLGHKSQSVQGLSPLVCDSAYHSAHFGHFCLLIEGVEGFVLLFLRLYVLGYVGGYYEYRRNVAVTAEKRYLVRDDGPFAFCRYVALDYLSHWFRGFYDLQVVIVIFAVVDWENVFHRFV